MCTIKIPFRFLAAKWGFQPLNRKQKCKMFPKNNHDRKFKVQELRYQPTQADLWSPPSVSLPRCVGDHEGGPGGDSAKKFGAHPWTPSSCPKDLEKGESLAQNPVKWLTQNHVRKYQGGRNYLWLGLSLTNLRLPRFCDQLLGPLLKMGSKMGKPKGRSGRFALGK